MSVTDPRQTSVDLVDRRRLLRCIGACGAAVPILAACGSDGDSPPEGSAGESVGSPGESLVATSEVPVGGGVILDDVIVVQPTEGEFLAYTAVCTHQGAKIADVNDGVMTCSLHGSQFAIEDGENLRGPNGSAAGSTADLPHVDVELDGDQIVLA